MRNLIPILMLFSFGAAAEVQFVPADQVQSYGSQTYDAKAFKNGDWDARAQMAADLIKKNPFVGKDFAEVEKELGKPDGHFQTDEPAYLIKKDGKDLIQLVFLSDSNGKKVSQVKAHKRFCSAVPPESTAITATKAGKKIKFQLTGEIAKTVYNHMKEIDAERGSRKGEGMTCIAGKTYVCNFSIDEEGVVEAK